MTSTAVRRETAEWVEPIGRVGLATQGALYAIVGLLALQVASGHNDRADQHGAMYAVGSQPFGRALLVVLIIGLALHCVWRLLLFVRGSPGADDAGDYAKRLGHLGRAAIYGTFTWGAFKVLVNSDNGSGGQQRQGLARVLDWPAGTTIVVIIGVIVIGTGLWHASKAFTRSFEDDLDIAGRSEKRGVVLALGIVGWFARGVCFVLVGWFVVQAAIDNDPNEGGGLDNALKRLVNSEHGPGLLRLLAIGVFTFGAYRVVDAFVRKRDAVSNA